MNKFLLIGIIFATFLYFNQAKERDTLEKAAEISETTNESYIQPAYQEPSNNQQFKCDGRTHCSNMTSCAEATFFLQNCPGVEMDGNGDGVPCEKQWCH